MPRDKIKLVSTGKQKDGKPTGYFRVTTINKKTRAAKGQGKLEKKCYDPRAYFKDEGEGGEGRTGGHVIFKESKMS